ncbi:MAG: hypothetical protein Kow0056_12690 [Coriobacteriia bacterium]
MPSTSQIAGTEIRNTQGKRLGYVEHVLFDISEARVVGFEVERPALWGLIQRRSRFLALGEVEFDREFRHGLVEWKRIPSPGVSAKRSGVDWDTTVIWRNMPVRTERGTDLGFVSDVSFSLSTGEVGSIVLSEGAATDLGVGRRKITGDEVLGFDGENVVVAEPVAKRPTSGGVATAAGVGTAVAKEVLGRATRNAAKQTGRIAGKTARRFKRGLQEWRDVLGGGDS